MPRQEVVKLSLKDRIRGVASVVKKSWDWNWVGVGGGWGGSWFPLVRESFPGAWQANVMVSNVVASSNWAVFACVTLIANDIAKMPAYVMAYNSTTKIWERVIKRKVLDVPNTYQVWSDFMRSWIFSLLLTGNTYVLRVLDDRGFVTALYVLDPRSVRPVVTPRGDVYYQVASDNLSGIQESVTVPANQIIHDRMNTFWHPLMGVSPLYASGMAAMQGIAMQENSAKFFQNMSRPGGILTAPGTISEESAATLKALWETEFAGESAGKIAVVGDGLKYEPMSMTAADSQLIEQLKFTGEMICATFHVPPYKLGIGTSPSIGNIAALNQQYFDQCLHPIVELIERRLDIGLEISYPEQVQFDTTELLRMDPSARWEAHTKKIASGAVAPNEVRREENLPPVLGGDTPYLQQQNYSLADLDLRSVEAHKKAALEDNGNVQATALNGAQVSSLQGLITAAAAGEIPVGSAKGAIMVAFPNLTPEEVDAMITPLDGFEPTAPATPTPPAAGAPGDTAPPAPAKSIDSEDIEATGEELTEMLRTIKDISEATI